MNCPKTQTVKTADISSESSGVLAGRSIIYAILGRGFSQPDEGVVDFFASCRSAGLEADGEVERALGALLESAGSVTLEDLRSDYIRLFDPLAGPFPYETEYKEANAVNKAQAMADIGGFYSAFGVEANLERCDHVAAELEFMHLLTLKESHAESSGEADKAAVCRDAAGKFFTEHLAVWSDGLLAGIHARRDAIRHPFYSNLVKLFEVFIKREKGSIE